MTTRFLPKLIVIIEWDKFLKDIKSDDEKEEIEENIIDIMNNSINTHNMRLAIEDGDVYVVNDDIVIERYIGYLISLIKYLNKEKIPWIGNAVAFYSVETDEGEQYEYKGFLSILGDNIVLSTFNEDDLELEIEYIPIYKEQKL